MLNNWTGMGRLTRDVEVRYLQESNLAIGRFTLAVERDYKPQDGERETDFISCISFGKTAEFISKYFRQGNMLAVTGSIQTGSYTNKDGVKVYTTEVRVEKASFTGEKKDDSQQPAAPPAGNDGFINAPEGLAEELPFM